MKFFIGIVILTLYSDFSTMKISMVIDWPDLSQIDTPSTIEEFPLFLYNK